MARRFLWVLWLVALVPPISDVRAGIYLTAEAPLLPLPTDLHTIRLRLLDFKSMALDDANVKEQTALRATYRARRELLEKRREDGLLLPLERIDLGAYYLRERRFFEARQILEEAERLGNDQTLGRFLLMANLASAYHGLAEANKEQRITYFDQAIDYQKRALSLWPELYPGWRVADGLFYRRVETFTLRLLTLRRADQRRALRDDFDQLDDLFEGVRFSPANGEYRIGGIALDMNDRIPPDAPLIVLQLVFWMPLDSRIYWQYAEILNTRNQVIEAATLLTELVVARNLKSIRELNRHRLELEEAADARKKLPMPLGAVELLALFAPRGLPLSPGLGQAAPEAVWPVVFAEYKRQAEPVTPAGTASDGSRLLDWNTVWVAFIAGAVVSLLLMLQIRQWRNRTGDSLNQRRISEG